MVAIFPKRCFWRRSLCSNLGGIDPEKLYRATLSKVGTPLQSLLMGLPGLQTLSAYEIIPHG